MNPTTVCVLIGNSDPKWSRTWFDFTKNRLRENPCDVTLVDDDNPDDPAAEADLMCAIIDDCSPELARRVAIRLERSLPLALFYHRDNDAPRIPDCVGKSGAPYTTRTYVFASDILRMIIDIVDHLRSSGTDEKPRPVFG